MNSEQLAERVNKVKNLPLSEIVSRYIDLKKDGDEKVGLCPYHKEKSPSFYVNDNKGVFNCFGCGAHGDIITFMREVETIDFMQALDRLEGDHKFSMSPAMKSRLSLKIEDDGGNTKIAKEIWAKTKPIQGTQAETYLRNRGITIDLPPTLRFAMLKHTTGVLCPTMVAAVTKWPDKEVIAIHRTFLTMDGMTKIPLRKPKMMLGSCKGGAVRLAPFTGQNLAVCEGIETALSVQQMSGKPTWAALSDGGITNLRLPDDRVTIYICADNDSNGVGQEAAKNAFHAWSALNYDLRIRMPDNIDTDWNDELLAGRYLVLS